MRLWHEALIPKLPRQQLLGQHRECCALRGLGWNKKHATVDYVFKYPPWNLYQYHMLVINEMKNRGYRNDPLWEDPHYRGKNCQPYEDIDLEKMPSYTSYSEHDLDYLKKCLNNLSKKGVNL